MTTIIVGTVTAKSGLNVRTSPGGDKAGYALRYGAQIKAYAEDKANQWVHVYEVDGTPVSGVVWVSSYYLDWAYEEVVIIPPDNGGEDPVATHLILIFPDGTISVDGDEPF